MRTIEEIKADIEAVKAYSFPFDKDGTVKQNTINDYEVELRGVISNGIPLPELEALCTAYREGRTVFIKKNTIAENLRELSLWYQSFASEPEMSWAMKLDDLADEMTCEEEEMKND